MKLYKISKFAMAYMLFSAILFSCSKDDDNTLDDNDAEGYETQVYITDAPIDNAEVEAVFVTVANVAINGKAIEGFEKTTIELSSLTNGETELLGSLQLEEGTTNSIVLELDNEADASGAAPGSYVLLDNGEKVALSATSETININDNAEITASDENQLILDFDLRKAISMNAEGEYSLVSNSRIANSIRVVNEVQAGAVTGTVQNVDDNDGEKLLVFAYEKGSYSDSEMEKDDSGLRFSNAVNSSVVSESNGEFSLNFLEEGEYELHFFSFSDEDSDGRVEMEGEVEMTTATDLNLLGLDVEADSTTNLDLTLVGLLDI